MQFLFYIQILTVSLQFITYVEKLIVQQKLTYLLVKHSILKMILITQALLNKPQNQEQESASQQTQSQQTKLTYFIEGHYYILSDYIIKNEDQAYQLAQNLCKPSQNQFKVINNQRVAEFSSSDGEEVIIQKKQRKAQKFKWTKQKQSKFQLICLLLGYNDISPRKIVYWMNDPQITNQVAGSHIQKWKMALLKQEGKTSWNQIQSYQYLIDLENQKIRKISRFRRDNQQLTFDENEIKFYLVNE